MNIFYIVFIVSLLLRDAFKLDTSVGPVGVINNCSVSLCIVCLGLGC